MRKMNRRQFLEIAAAGGSLLLLRPFRSTARAVASLDHTTSVWVVHGTDIPRMLETGIERMGGWSSFFTPGQKVTLKPNIAWASTPEQGANTNPTLVGACVAACRTAGCTEPIVCENTCSPSEQAFRMSGIAEAVKKAGGRLYALKDKDYRTTELPKAKILKKADIAADVLDCACLINMPVAKVHGGAGLTISLKNWMGAVKDRGAWHRTGLHQCIADFSTRIKPSLIIVDATRILVTNGPRGPGKLEYPDQLVFGRDPVAVDAYTATLFNKDPFAIPYIKIAHEMGLGCGDLSKVNVKHLHV